jgi:hypothetical protein
MTNRHELVAINEVSSVPSVPSAPTGVSYDGYNTSFYPSIPSAHGMDPYNQSAHPTPYGGQQFVPVPASRNGTLKQGDGCADFSERTTNYKINKIGDYIKYLDAELRDRERLKKSYGKFDKTLFGVECTCMVTELGVTGASFFLPLVSTPICLGLTLFSAVLRNGSKMLTRKIDKHSAIELLAKSKRNSIDEKYTKAMEDGVISDVEFQDIRKEIANYDEMKKTILKEFKKGHATELTKEAQLSLINKGKEEMKEELKTKLKL